MKTLIVEDNLTESLLLQILLRPQGHCDAVSDGHEALRLVSAAEAAGQPYDLICLDIAMPRMDGQAVLQAIRAAETGRGVLLGHGVKVIMTTSHGDPPNVLHAFREQCDGYLLKPVSRDKLLKLLTELHLLDGPRPAAAAV